MANECHEDDNELQVKPIHFKIILTNSLLEGKLMIPRTFVKKYAECLPKTVFLKPPPNGVEWEVKFGFKRVGKILQSVTLAEGHIVVFRYERTSNFQVLIFDMSALEIDYPFKRVEGKSTSSDKGNKPPMAGSLQDYRPSQKRKDNSSPEFLQQFNEKSRRVEVESISNLSEEALHQTGKKCNDEPKTTAKQITALEKASSFKPSNPSFLVFMHPSYLHSKANLNIPAKFGKRYFDLSIKQGDMNLQLATGRVWPARYLIRETNIGPKFELSSGWKPFAKDNNLKVGDVCTFELIDRTKLTFQVHIFRETGNSNCSTSQGFKLTVSSPEEEDEMSGLPSSNFAKKPTTAAKENTVLQRASFFKSCHPSFLLVMHLSYVSSRERLNTSKFGKRYFDLSIKNGDVKLCLANGRVWPARCLIRETSKGLKFELKTGWNSFVKDNNLKVGDACTFELIERTMLTFKVYIFRETDNSNFLTSQESADGPRNHESPIKEEWEYGQIGELIGQIWQLEIVECVA